MKENKPSGLSPKQTQAIDIIGVVYERMGKLIKTSLREAKE